MRTKGDWITQVVGKLVMKLGKTDKSKTYATDKLRFVVVKEIGNSKYFHAARDYMLEQNTRLHVRHFKSGSHEIRITAMRHESTDMKVIETFHTNPKIYGMPGVVTDSKDNYDLILNGNFVFFEDGENGGNKTKQVFNMDVLHGMTNRCYGGCVVGKVVSPASAPTGNKLFQQKTAKYLSANGKGTFNITIGVVPLSPAIHQAALGGFGSNLLSKDGTHFYNIHPWFGIAEIGSPKEHKKLILTVTTTAATTQYPVADLIKRLSASGVPPFVGDLEPGRILCVAGDGGTSNATAHRIEGDITRVRFAGTKHYPGHYWVNTYVGFKSDKPRP